MVVLVQFPEGYNLGMYLPFAHLQHSLIPFDCLETDKFEKLLKHVLQLEEVIDEINSWKSFILEMLENNSS